MVVIVVIDNVVVVTDVAVVVTVARNVKFIFNSFSDINFGRFDNSTYLSRLFLLTVIKLE